jgi:hypothetical protein
MPPRHAYWTILVDNLPTAFRAADREDLLPTFERLRRKHPSAALMWFARGRLWASPEAARASRRAQEERRGPGWRPGGQHRDPREQFRKERQERNAARRRERHEQRQQRSDRDSAPGRDTRRPARASSPPGIPREEKRRPDRRPPARPHHDGGRAGESRGAAPRKPAGTGGQTRRDAPTGRRPPPSRRDGWSAAPTRQPRGPKPESRGSMQGRSGGRPPRPPRHHPAGTSGSGSSRTPARSETNGKPPWRDGRERERARRAPVEGRGDRRGPRGPGRQTPARSEPVKERRYPAAPPPGLPPGPDRPPRPGAEPPPVPTRADEIVAPTPPPERGRDEDA